MGGGGAPRSGSAEPLIGRDREVGFLRSFVDQAAAQGGALLLSGDAGVGKTVLLDAAATQAAARKASTPSCRAAGSASGVVSGGLPMRVQTKGDRSWRPIAPDLLWGGSRDA
jgi:hypothetical protein